MAVLVALLATLHALGGTRLAAPPVHGAGEWLESRDAATAALAVVRLVAVAAGWYLLATTAASLLLHLVRARRLAAAVERAAPRLVGRLVRAAAGLTLTATAATTIAPAGAQSDVVVMRRIDGPDDAITMRRLDEPAEPAEPRREWVVRTGDSFWRIAESLVSDAWGRAPTDRELDGYWRLLISHNRANLADPANPDLLHPGDVLAVPAVPPIPAPAEV
jgi:hypothetical protein